MEMTLEKRINKNDIEDTSSLNKEDRQELSDLRKQVRNGWNPYFMSSKSDAKRIEKILTQLGATEMCYYCFEDSLTGNKIHFYMYK